MSRARLLQRVLDMGLERCPNYGGALKVMAANLEAVVIEKTLGRPRRGLRPPPR